MNKTELIDEIAAAADLPKASAGRALDAVLDTITNQLKAKEQVSLVGFGTFSVKERSARTGRNPQTERLFKSRPQRLRVSKQGKH